MFSGGADDYDGGSSDGSDGDGGGKSGETFFSVQIHC